MTEQLMELADRCEKATVPDFRLDEEILRGCGWTYEEYDEPGEEPGYVWRDPDGKIPTIFPSPTASLDAAMQIVPEGWGWEVRGCGLAMLLNPLPPDKSKPSKVEARAATPALALCAAALRARAQSENLGGGDE